MSVIESIGITIGSRIGGAMWDKLNEIYNDWVQGRRMRIGMAIGADGGLEMLPEQEGVILSTAYHNKPLLHPLIVSGAFVADEFLVDFADIILENEEKVVLLIAIDEETGEVFLAEYDFEGYAMAFWPGTYSLYAFIIDPLLDDMLAIGYPAWGDLQDPNPISLTGAGEIELDFVLFDIDDYD